MGFFNESVALLKTWAISSGMTLICTALFVIAGFWIINKVSKLLIVFLQKANMDTGMISFLDSISKLLLRFIIIISALASLGVNVTSIITAVGASLVTIGLALKDSLSNIASGVLLVMSKPFHVGDYIEFDSVKGTVEKLEMMFTTLRAEDDKVIIVPNSKLTSNNITRKSPHNICQVKINHTVSALSDLSNVKKIISAILLSENKALPIPPASVELDAKDDGNFCVTSVFWCEEKDKKHLTGKISDSISSSLNKRNIEIIKDI